MCLPIAIERPNDVLAQGKHRGIEWMVIHNTMGYRCGYARIPKGHPWHKKDTGDIHVRIHGGLTFAAMDVPCGKGGADDAYWIGFDCAHCGDAPDPSLNSLLRGDVLDLLSLGGVVRTQRYVEKECRSLCEQIAKAA